MPILLLTYQQAPVKEIPPPARVAKAIKAAKALVKASKFAEAIALLEKRQKELGEKITSTEKRFLQITIADSYYERGQNAEERCYAERGIDYKILEEAIEYYKSAYTLDIIHRKQLAARDSRELGKVYGYYDVMARDGNTAIRARNKSLEYYEMSLSISKLIKDNNGYADTLNQKGMSFTYNSMSIEALPLCKEALSIYMKIGNKVSSAVTLNNIGSIYDDLGEKRNAIDFYKQELTIQRQLKDNNSEVSVLSNIANLYYTLDEQSEALIFCNQALPIYRQQQDIEGEAYMLTMIGSIYNAFGKNTKALDFLNKALPLSKTTRFFEYTLICLGDTYSDINNKVKSLEFYDKAQRSYLLRYVDGYRLGYNNPIENKIGDAYFNFGDISDALNHYKKALYEGVGIQISIAIRNIGKTYSFLGEKNKALEFYSSSLQALRNIKKENIKYQESITLYYIGNTYYDIKEYHKSLDFHNNALSIQNQLGYRHDEAYTLISIGRANNDLGERTKALEFLNQARLILRQTGDIRGEAIVTTDIGSVYSSLGENTKALEYYNRSLPIQRQIGDKRGEAQTLNKLMSLWSNLAFSRRNLGMATFYGKQCVNRYQALREDAKKIGKRALESFTNSVEKAYRDQADILIEQGRILEGQQVLDLLKQQELFDLLRRDAKEFNTAKLTELNEVEAEADRRIKAQGDRILTLAREEETLLAKPEALRADADKRRLLEVKRLLDEAQAQFQKVLESLVALFEQSAARLAAKPFTPADAEAFTTTLKDLREQSGKKPVAVYTLMGENKLRFIILSDLGNPVAREFPITAAELNKKIAAFRIALQNPSVDPRPLGKQLYDILIKPIEADLSGAQAQTLLWSLDGPLRYIPLAALSPDGVHYLIETERANTIFTPAAMNSGALTRAPKPQWQALALGVTQGFASVENQGTTLGFPALTGVRQEVGTVTGLLTGSTTLLDADFTKERLEATLAEKAGKFSVVHIASHFHFQPTGDETRSFLLTGDGKALTLAQLKSLRSNVFSGVDLLTLSACATGLGTVGASGTGAEVEGFGALAQRKGAGAVLASLWSVSDASTSALMQAFYAIHQKEPGLGKAECLRRAQLGLLTGSLPIEARQLGRGPVAATGNKDTTGLPRFVAPASAPAAHPFYWAPFILIGNTR